MLKELIKNMGTILRGTVPFTLLAFHTLDPVVALFLSGFVFAFVASMAEEDRPYIVRS